jgi:hypothetical protein
MNEVRLPTATKGEKMYQPPLIDHHEGDLLEGVSERENPKPEPKGPRWRYRDAIGLEREGFMIKFVDHGGTDVTYFFERDDGRLDVVPGPRMKWARNIQAEYLKRIEEDSSK